MIQKTSEFDSRVQNFINMQMWILWRKSCSFYFGKCSYCGFHCVAKWPSCSVGLWEWNFFSYEELACHLENKTQFSKWQWPSGHLQGPPQNNLMLAPKTDTHDGCRNPTENPGFLAWHRTVWLAVCQHPLFIRTLKACSWLTWKHAQRMSVELPAWGLLRTARPAPQQAHWKQRGRV